MINRRSLELVLLAATALILPQGSAAQAPVRHRSFALIIGNNVAPGTALAPLRYADDDAFRNAELLAAAGVDLRLLVVADPDSRRRFASAATAARAPTRTNLEAALKEINHAIRAKNAEGAETSFYFFYSGHGELGPGNEGRLFLHTASDGRLTRGQLLRDIIGSSPATYNHLIIDACHAYFMVEPKGETAAAQFAAVLRSYLDLETLAAHPNTGVVVSTSSRAEVHEWSLLEAGLFSHQIRSALSGAADADLDGQVSYHEVGAFLAAANHDVIDIATKIVHHVRAPRVNSAMALLHDAPDDKRAHLELAASAAGSVVVTDNRGLRTIDFNKAEGTPTKLRMVAGHSYTIELGTQLGEVVATPAAVVPVVWRLGSGRSVAPSRILAGLFGRPYGPRFVEGYVAARATHGSEKAAKGSPNTGAVPKDALAMVTGDVPNAGRSRGLGPNHQTPNGGADIPFADPALLKDLLILTDAQGHLAAIEIRDKKIERIFFGNSERLYRQRLRSWSYVPPNIEAGFWEPRYRDGVHKKFIIEPERYLLRCSEQTIQFVPAPPSLGARLKKTAQLMEPRWQRKPFGLARDLDGTYYYVDMRRGAPGDPDDFVLFGGPKGGYHNMNPRASRFAADPNDYRLFVGRRGRVERIPLNEAITDGPEALFIGARGRLALPLFKKEAKWFSGGREIELTRLDNYTSGPMIHTHLGVYRGQPLGTLCDPYWQD